MIETILDGVLFVVKKVFGDSNEAKIEDLKNEIADFLATELTKTNLRIDNLEEKITTELSNLVKRHENNFYIKGNFIVLNNNESNLTPNQELMSKLFSVEQNFVEFEEAVKSEKAEVILLENKNEKKSDTKEIVNKRLNNILLTRKGYS